MAIKILQILESFPMNFTMVEAYDNLLIYANDHNMQTTILTYASFFIQREKFSKAKDIAKQIYKNLIFHSHNSPALFRAVKIP
ncbi:hypothetical protein VWM83_09715, partial [Campylobacter coli]